VLRDLAGMFQTSKYCLAVESRDANKIDAYSSVIALISRPRVAFLVEQAPRSAAGRYTPVCPRPVWRPRLDGWISRNACKREFPGPRAIRCRIADRLRANR
jgi:hypothetical protein